MGEQNPSLKKLDERIEKGAIKAPAVEQAEPVAWGVMSEDAGTGEWHWAGIFDTHKKAVDDAMLFLGVSRITALYTHPPATDERLCEAKDLAYAERNKCVIALVALARRLGWTVGLGRHEGGDWEDDWRSIVYIDTPAGQVSWHFHDSERHMIERLPSYEGDWDGHTTVEKYERLEALGTQEPAVQQTERVLLMEFQDFYQMCTEEEAKVMVDQFFDEQKP